MDLTQIKEQINKAGFPEQFLQEMNTILDAAIARGEMNASEKEKIDELMANAIEENELHTNVLLQIDTPVPSL